MSLTLDKGLRQRVLDSANSKKSSLQVQQPSSAVGLLLGASSGNQIISAVPLSRAIESSIDWSAEVVSIEACIPAGIQVVGLFQVFESEEHQTVPLEHFAALKKSIGDDRRIFYFRTSSHSSTSESASPAGKLAAFSEADGVVSEYVQAASALCPLESGAVSWASSGASLVALRVQGDITLDFKWATGSLEYLSQSLVKEDLGGLVLIAEPSLILQPGDERTLRSALAALPAFKGFNAKQIESHLLERPLLAELLFHSSAKTSAPIAPLISVVTEASNPRISATLNLDLVVSSSIDSKITEWLSLVNVAYQRQGSKILSTFAAALKATTPIIPRSFHFTHPSFPFVLTATFPIPVGVPSIAAVDESSLLPIRKNMHQLIGIAEDLPYFRFARIHSFLPPPENPQRLRDPHLGLPSSGVKGAQSFLVKGSYDYYHYMQDRFDDNGWGCAYRSLQTICSWFVRQGYTAKPPPSIPEIQQTLVKIGDKPQSFVGSRQWIGSMELGWVLEEWYKGEFPVTNRCLAQIQGSEMQDHARTLAHHFETQGTPIMIGGAAMAHTILGIDFNPEMGTLKYLILDPHYTGAENLKTIQSKGWCGWKDPGFWNPNAPYNLCLPQKPSEI